MEVRKMFRVSLTQAELHTVIRKKSLEFAKKAIPEIRNIITQNDIVIILKQNHEKIPEITFECKICLSHIKCLEEITIKHLYHMENFIDFIIDEALEKEKIKRSSNEKISVEKKDVRASFGTLSKDEEVNLKCITFDFLLDYSLVSDEK